MSTQTPTRPKVIYPESDGQPMAENTLQFEWITTIKGGLDAQFRNDPNVFVAGDLFWYPVEGDNTIRRAPDAMAVFGRLKGHRGSYLQWEEDNIPPQVVFEILSPGNRGGELVQKFNFYERYGVEEYYVYDPDSGDLNGWQRAADKLQEIPSMAGWVSPRLKIRFEPIDGDLRILGPDGRPFATYVELVEQIDELARQRQQLAQQGDKERHRAERLAAQLKALGVEPEV